MKIGIEVDWQRRHFNINRERIQLCDKLGYDVAFCAENAGSDAISPLGYILGCTDRIGVGTRIAQNTARTAPALAMAYQTLRHMAGPDRPIVAGIGSSNPFFTEGWHGLPWTSAYWRMRDYVAVMKKAFSGEVLTYEGKIIKIPYHAEGEEPKYAPRAPMLETDPNIPIIFGGGTELMLSLAAEIGDGLLPNGSWSPGAMKIYGPMIEKGLAKRKTPMKLEDFPIWAHVDVFITDDIKAGMQQFKEYTAKWTGFHVGAGGHRELMTWRGWGDVADRVWELYTAGHIKEAEEAVPDEYVDECWLIGPIERIVERWRKYWIDDGCNLIVRTDNWPSAKPSNNDAFEPLIRALRD
jgi:alkanesulfonate monooxygenase SsuD/methylene tetrahydromethanopterin reductase-like flavin-dependent oxidoreductase (luciferase family)